MTRVDHTSPAVEITDGVIERPTTTDQGEAERRIDNERELLKRIAPTDLAWEQGGDRLCADAIRAHAESACGHMVEMGRWLIYAKSQLDHGRFGAFLSDQGISWTQANRVMLIARRIASHPQLHSLSKHRALLVCGFSDEQLVELAKDGETQGISIDEIRDTPVRELEQQIRTLTKQVDKGKEQLKRAKQHTERLQEELDAQGAPPRDDARLIDAFHHSWAALAELRHRVATLRQEGDVPASALARIYALLQREIGELRQQHPDLINAETLLGHSGRVDVDALEDDLEDIDPAHRE